MAEMAYVCLYSRYLQTLEPFTDAERGRIMTGMLTYAATGEAPLFDGNERYIWPTIQAQIDRDVAAYHERCEKNRSNGSKGGRPKKQAVISETERFLEKPKKAKTNTNTKINTKSNDIESDKPPTHHKYGEYKNVLLSDDEFEKLKADIPDCLQLIERLSEYMESTGKKYKSHYATIRSWSRKEKPSGQAESKPIWTVGTVV